MACGIETRRSIKMDVEGGRPTLSFERASPRLIEDSQERERSVGLEKLVKVHERSGRGSR